MTCKDCIHYDACCEIGGKLQEHYMNKCTDVDCKHFMWRDEEEICGQCPIYTECKFRLNSSEEFISCAELIGRRNIASSDDGTCGQCPIYTECKFRLNSSEEFISCYEILAEYILNELCKECDKNK